MKRGVILMIIYAISMVFYGTVEIGHDVLHYLADHYQSHLHNHHHGHDHSISDHDHHHKHHHHHEHISHDSGGGTQQTESLPSGLSFFLFIESATRFQFTNENFLGMYTEGKSSLRSCYLLPATPPPKSETFFG